MFGRKNVFRPWGLQVILPTLYSLVVADIPMCRIASQCPVLSEQTVHLLPRLLSRLKCAVMCGPTALSESVQWCRGQRGAPRLSACGLRVQSIAQLAWGCRRVLVEPAWRRPSFVATHPKPRRWRPRRTCRARRLVRVPEKRAKGICTVGGVKGRQVARVKDRVGVVHLWPR